MKSSHVSPTSVGAGVPTIAVGRLCFSCSESGSFLPWSALDTAALWRKRGGKWTQGDHFHRPKPSRASSCSVSPMDIRRVGIALTSRAAASCDQAQLRGLAIGRRVLPPDVAGLLSQWGRERHPSVSAFGVLAPSRGVAHAPQSLPSWFRKSSTRLCPAPGPGAAQYRAEMRAISRLNIALKSCVRAGNGK
jgi:hypothetical protein